MFEQNPQDVALYTWLENVNCRGIRILLNTETEVLVSCESETTADKLWRSRSMLGQKHPTIWVKKRRYTPAPSPSQLDKKQPSNCANTTMLNLQVNSEWARQNLERFNQYSGTCYVYSTDEGFKHLAVRPELSEGRLNKKVELLLSNGGQPLSVIDEVIAVPRREGILRAIASGEEELVYHEHFWMGLTWYFETAIRKVNDREVLVRVYDNPKEPRAWWQRGFWERRAEAERMAQSM